MIIANCKKCGREVERTNERKTGFICLYCRQERLVAYVKARRGSSERKKVERNASCKKCGKPVLAPICHQCRYLIKTVENKSKIC